MGLGRGSWLRSYAAGWIPECRNDNIHHRAISPTSGTESREPVNPGVRNTARLKGHEGGPSHAHRSLHVRAAVCGQVAQRGDDMKKSGAGQDPAASKLISRRIAELGDWRGTTLSRMRSLIKEADPDVVEELKWVKP